MRTSSASNVGQGKDSETRQRIAIETFAAHSGYEIIEWYYDEAISGADPIEERPGFTELLDCIDDNGVRTVIVEDQSRFARDMEAHVLGLALLRERGVRLITSNGTDLTDETDEMTEAMIHIAAVFSALEKKRLVKKLRGARARKRAEQGKCEGRKSHLEKHPGAVAMAKKLHRANPKTGKRMSLRKISAALAEAGHLNEHGRPFHTQSIKRMVEGRKPVHSSDHDDDGGELLAAWRGAPGGV